MNKTERIGVFGGTFDPIHEAHIRIAKAALNQARLDRVLFVVASDPPHKLRAELHAAPEERFAMVQAALAGESGLEPSRVELDRDGPSYTDETLSVLERQFPGAELFLILGMDSLADLPKWRNFKAILTTAQLLVAPRPGKYHVSAELDGRYTMLDIDPVEISSTEVRNRAANREAYEELLPPPVRRYVKEHGTYES